MNKPKSLETNAITNIVIFIQMYLYSSLSTGVFLIAIIDVGKTDAKSHNEINRRPAVIVYNFLFRLVT